MQQLEPLLHRINLPSSLKEVAFEAIRESIILGKLKPGSVYREQIIAEELGISKTPVREAFINLANRGFVTILPRKGYQVNQLTRAHIREIFEFRLAMERAVLLHIGNNLDDSEIKNIESINREAGRKRDRALFPKVDKEFHRRLATLTNNRYLIKALEEIWDLCEWIASVVYAIEGRHEEVIREHNAIIEMLKSRDASGAAEAMAYHLEVTESKYVSQLEFAST